MTGVKKVSVLSTGSVWIRPQHAHSTAPTAWWLFTSRRWIGPLPINVYVIEHERGLVLFDTGQDRASVTDPGYFPTGFPGFIHRRLARFEIAEDETLDAGLERLGYRLADVDYVVLSHLHQDHIGGLPRLAGFGQPVLISGPEKESLHRPGAEGNGLLPAHTDLPGIRWETVLFSPTTDPDLVGFGAAYDVLDDGSLMLVPTPGHTEGSLSMLLREEGRPPLLFVGDLTYDIHLFDADKVPGVGKRGALHDSTRIAKELRERHPDLVVLAAHDPGAAAALRAAWR